ncbi:MAG: hypothetical protein LBU32_30595 [Clostridiales bacterium]|jgi:hypothetical protein|nr:hypothetical protein [Clostridiales bacterium]
MPHGALDPCAFEQLLNIRRDDFKDENEPVAEETHNGVAVKGCTCASKVMASTMLRWRLLRAHSSTPPHI